MKKFILNFLFIAYAVIAVFVTVCLLSFNQFKVTEFGNDSLVIVSDDSIEPDFSEGDLVIVNKKNKIAIGDKVFFYNTYEREIEVCLGTVIGAERITETELTYTLEGNKRISSQYVLGPARTAETIEKVGGILGILESKWGFLFLIVLPSLIAFVYQISVVFTEIRESKNDKG